VFGHLVQSVCIFRVETLCIAFTYLKQMMQLIASGNQFAEIPRCVFKMGRLQVLGFSRNRIKAIPPDIALLQNLQVSDTSCLMSQLRAVYRVVQIHCSFRATTNTAIIVIYIRLLYFFSKLMYLYVFLFCNF